MQVNNDWLWIVFERGRQCQGGAGGWGGSGADGAGDGRGCSGAVGNGRGRGRAAQAPSQQFRRWFNRSRRLWSGASAEAARPLHHGPIGQSGQETRGRMEEPGPQTRISTGRGKVFNSAILFSMFELVGTHFWIFRILNFYLEKKKYGLFRACLAGRVPSPPASKLKVQ